MACKERLELRLQPTIMVVAPAALGQRKIPERSVAIGLSPVSRVSSETAGIPPGFRKRRQALTPFPKPILQMAPSAQTASGDAGWKGSAPIPVRSVSIRDARPPAPARCTSALRKPGRKSTATMCASGSFASMGVDAPVPQPMSALLSHVRPARPGRLSASRVSAAPPGPWRVCR